MVTILLSMLYLTFLDMELLSKNVSIMTFIINDICIDYITFISVDKTSRS